jgi:hypothetical protein
MSARWSIKEQRNLVETFEELSDQLVKLNGSPRKTVPEEFWSSVARVLEMLGHPSRSGVAVRKKFQSMGVAVQTQLPRQVPDYVDAISVLNASCSYEDTIEAALSGKFDAATGVVLDAGNRLIESHNLEKSSRGIAGPMPSISFRVEHDAMRKLEEIAEREGVSRTFAARMLIEAGLEADAKGKAEVDKKWGNLKYVDEMIFPDGECVIKVEGKLDGRYVARSELKATNIYRVEIGNGGMKV